MLRNAYRNESKIECSWLSTTGKAKILGKMLIEMEIELNALQKAYLLGEGRIRRNAADVQGQMTLTCAI